MITSSAAPAVARKIQVGGSISFGAESVCAFSRVGVKEKHVHLFTAPSTCKFTACQRTPHRRTGVTAPLTPLAPLSTPSCFAMLTGVCAAH